MSRLAVGTTILATLAWAFVFLVVSEALAVLVLLAAGVAAFGLRRRAKRLL